MAHCDKTIRDVLATWKICSICDKIYPKDYKPGGKICHICTRERAKEVMRRTRAAKRLAKGMERATSINQTL